MPFLKSMDPAEGRNIATLEMLPRWEGFIVSGASTNISTWEAIKTVKDLSFCMTQTLMEQDGRVAKHVPSSYDFSNVSCLLIGCFKLYFQCEINVRLKNALVM